MTADDRKLLEEEHEKNEAALYEAVCELAEIDKEMKKLQGRLGELGFLAENLHHRGGVLVNRIEEIEKILGE